MKYVKTYFFSLFMLVAVLTSCKEENTGYTNDPATPIIVDDFFPKQGGGGTEILINGSNFSSDISAISVTVNGTPLKVIGASGSQIMVVVPKKLGTGQLEISIGNNTGISTQSFDYLYTRTVTTLAGSGTAGFANGQGTDAMFNFNGEGWYRSMGIAVDDNLNVYVADPGNHCIRKIDAEGNVTTFAGNPNIAGQLDARGTQAQFNLPYGVAIDEQGNLYVADPGNWNIRKITPDGDVTTLVSTFSDPWSVAVDQVGNVYYGCPNVSNVYSVAPHEAIIFGINYPAGIAIDKAGNLYVSASLDHTIRKYAANTWTETVIAGQPGVEGYTNGIGSQARFASPWGLAIDEDDNLYVAGNGTWDGGTYNPDQSIRLIEAGTWNVSTFAGSGSAGFVNAIGESAAFSGPGGVCVDKNGTVYVLDKGNNAVRKIVSE
mgnify:CR=1 FL=1